MPVCFTGVPAMKATGRVPPSLGKDLYRRDGAVAASAQLVSYQK